MDSTEYTSPRRKPGFFQDSTNFLLIGIIGILIILLGGIYVLISRSRMISPQKPTTSQAPIPTITLSKTMTVFTSKLGFSIMYPDNLTPVEHVGKKSVTFTNAITGNQIDYLTVTIVPVPFKNSPTANRTTDDINYVTDWKEITVNGQKGHSYITNPCKETCRTLTVDLPFTNGTNILTITSSRIDSKLFNEIVSKVTLKK